MESINKNPLLEFLPNTLQDVRTMYNLEQKGRMKDAVHILQEWMKKQNHLTQIYCDEGYIERLIIVNKGLLERVKEKLDKICTLRTLMPDYFRSYAVKEFKNLDILIDAVLPKTTPDYHRVYIFKNIGKKFTSSQFLNYYKRIIILFQYLSKHDYSAGFIMVFDYLETDLIEVIKLFNITDFQQAVTIIMEGFGYRIKGVHILTQSKIIDTFVGLVKTVLKPKIAERIHVHNGVDALKKIFHIEILPKEYGGNEKTLKELNDEWINILSSQEHIEFMDKLNEARITEPRGNIDRLNEDHLGIPGTFRTLNLD